MTQRKKSKTKAAIPTGDNKAADQQKDTDKATEAHETVATIAGALPPALAIGPGAEVQRPMALALVGGMVVSTVLTLFVVPAAYSALDDIVGWNKDRRRRGEGLVAAIGALRRVSSSGYGA